MTATLWLDTATEQTLELGGTLQLYAAFADMAHAAGPTCYQDYPDLFGVPGACEDQCDVDPVWLGGVRAQARQFLAKFGRHLRGAAPGILQLLIGVTSHAEAPVRQSTGWTCGPAALATAARLVGLATTEAQAQALAGASPDDGTPPEAMVDAARQLGLDVQAVERMTPEQLAAAVQAGQPVVICMVAPALDSTAVTDSSGHWAVIVGADAGGFTLQDPAAGEVRLPAAELMARWEDQDSEQRIYSRFGIVVKGRGK